MEEYRSILIQYLNRYPLEWIDIAGARAYVRHRGHKVGALQFVERMVKWERDGIIEMKPPINEPLCKYKSNLLIKSKNWRPENIVRRST